MHTSRTLPGKADERERERARGPPSLNVSSPPFYKDVKIPRATTDDNLARRWNCDRETVQFMSPAFFHREKNRSGRDPLVTREKFLPVSGDESEKEGERENFILFSPSLLSRRFLLTALLTGNWKLLNFESIWLFRVTRNITNNETLNRKVDLWRLYRGNTRITRIHASVFLASINIETKKQTLRAKLEDPFSPSTSRVKIIGHDNMQ